MVRLHCTYLPAVEHAPSTVNLVLLHGWGIGSDVWRHWLPLLQTQFNLHLIDFPGYGKTSEVDQYEWPELVAAIVDIAPAKSIYVGYSLGGMLAVKVATLYPDRVSALVTLATNAQFVASDEWPQAMDEKTFQQFSNLVNDKPSLALKRFAGLQAYGCAEEKPLLKAIRDLISDISDTTLIQTLEILSGLNNVSVIDDLSVPSLFLFGENDNLVPVEAKKYIVGKSTEVDIIAESPHAFFISHSVQTFDRIKNFLHHKKIIALPSLRDKKQVAKSFSRAAAGYDSAANFQRQVGRSLFELLPKNIVETVLDLGCGTGFFYQQLKCSYPQAEVYGLDLAEEMVKHCANHQQGDFLCADAEILPLADASIDIIYSNLVLQWCENNIDLFSEIFRVLKPGGRIIFSTLGPNSLHELRQAWSAVDDYVHVNRFAEREILQTAIEQAGFDISANEMWSEQIITLEYKTLRELTWELKSIGAHNVNNGRPTGLMGRQRMQTFVTAYEQQRSTMGLLPASYQVWYGELQKSATTCRETFRSLALD